MALPLGPGPGTVRALRLSRSYVYQFETYDTRKWKINETMRRYMIGLKLGGAERVSGVGALRPKIRRWCVNKSPHIDKKAMQHFEMVTNRRHISFEWDVKSEVANPASRNMPIEIARRNVENVSTRIESQVPALLFLPQIFDALANPGKYVKSDEPVTLDDVKEILYSPDDDADEIGPTSI
ncbi:30S ribosomal protein S10 [Porphyridium purpureum]|uniref:30S ribosomal protein S10 n=1 Tax=Porphyridium purpureum TaxID=35688 RepID=A0A5J4Z1L9_PORPP|nr:30S ribosomal protein S10 [Porphyridium purpureum]|eukprot:POR7877..scf295_1